MYILEKNFVSATSVSSTKTGIDFLRIGSFNVGASAACTLKTKYTPVIVGLFMTLRIVTTSTIPCLALASGNRDCCRALDVV